MKRQEHYQNRTPPHKTETEDHQLSCLLHISRMGIHEEKDVRREKEKDGGEITDNKYTV